MCGLFFFLLLFCVTCRVLSKKTNFVCVCASVCLTVLLLFFFFVVVVVIACFCCGLIESGVSLRVSPFHCYVCMSVCWFGNSFTILSEWVKEVETMKDQKKKKQKEKRHERLDVFQIRWFS